MWIKHAVATFRPRSIGSVLGTTPTRGGEPLQRMGKETSTVRSRLSDGTGDVEQVGLGASQGAEQITASDLLGMQAISLGLLSQVRPLTRRARHGI